MVCVLTQTEGAELLVNELSSARLEATTARARVEEALSALAVRKRNNWRNILSQCLRIPQMSRCHPLMRWPRWRHSWQKSRTGAKRPSPTCNTSWMKSQRCALPKGHHTSLTRSPILRAQVRRRTARRPVRQQLSDALEAKEMAVAQASMLRSCLEDTEELLEGSRASMNHLETKIYP